MPSPLTIVLLAAAFIFGAPAAYALVVLAFVLELAIAVYQAPPRP